MGPGRVIQSAYMSDKKNEKIGIKIIIKFTDTFIDGHINTDRN